MNKKFTMIKNLIFPLLLLMTHPMLSQNIGINNNDPMTAVQELTVTSSTSTIPNTPRSSYWSLIGSPVSDFILNFPTAEKGVLMLVENTTTKFASIPSLSKIAPGKSKLFVMGNTTWILVIDESQLEKISESGNTGFRLLGSNPDNYGDIGANAVDLSISASAGVGGATGSHSFAAGISTTSSGNYSTSFGNLTKATGPYSTAFGNSTQATGSSSVAMGYESKAIGNNSTAFGYDTKAIGTSSTAFGYRTISSGLVSTSFGFLSSATGDFSTAMGTTKARSYYSTSIGRYNDTIAGSNPTSWVPKDPLFYIGNGSSENSRSNALLVYKNGDTDLNGNLKVLASTSINGDLNVAGITTLKNKTIISPAATAIDVDTITNKISFGQILDNGGWNVGLGIGGKNGNTWGIGSIGGSLFFALGNTTNNSLQTAIEINQNRNLFLVPISGNVGIGTTNVNGRLQFANELNNRKIVLWESANNNHQFFGLGIESGTMRYQVAGDHNVHRFYAGINSTSSSLLFTLFHNGNATLAGTLTQLSDKRLKKNILPISNSFGSIMALNGYNYNWISKDKDQGLQTGLIAQEVEKLFPHLVVKDEAGMLSVNYIGLIPYMIENIKTLKIEKESHDERSNNEISILKSRIEKLELLLEKRISKTD
jgi:hypothetical protein